MPPFPSLSNTNGLKASCIVAVSKMAWMVVSRLAMLVLGGLHCACLTCRGHLARLGSWGRRLGGWGAVEGTGRGALSSCTAACSVQWSPAAGEAAAATRLRTGSPNPSAPGPTRLRGKRRKKAPVSSATWTRRTHVHTYVYTQRLYQVLAADQNVLR